MPEFNLFAPLTAVLIKYVLWAVPIIVSLLAFRVLLPSGLSGLVAGIQSRNHVPNTVRFRSPGR